MKQRIFFGLAPLFILLIAMGVYAVTLFAKLGNRIDVILRENFRSVLAGQQMKETAERMDSALFFSLVGEEERGRKLYAQNLPGFRESLRTELDNITLPGEAELATKVKAGSRRVCRARGDLLGNARYWRPAAKCISARCCRPSRDIKDTAQEIIRINQDNMVQADREARHLAAESTRYMIFAIAAGIAGAIFFAARLQRSILRADPSPHDGLEGTRRRQTRSGRAGDARTTNSASSPTPSTRWRPSCAPIARRWATRCCRRGR